MSILPILLGKNQRKMSPDIEDVFSTFLYTGTAAAKDVVNGIDLKNEGGMVWTKARDTTTYHFIGDTELGPTNYLNSNTTNGLASNLDAIKSFNADGYSIGNLGGYNSLDKEFVSWTFRKAKGFFDIVKYTGDGLAGRQIPHDLGCAPGMIVVKSLSVEEWCVYHRGNTSAPETDFLYLNRTDATNDVTIWNDTAPTKTVFTVGGTAKMVNDSGVEYIAYLFAHDPDQDTGVIQCGSYLGNGSADGPEVDLGWEPQWLLVKDTDASTQWAIFDTMRGVVVGGDDKPIYPSSTVAEQTVSAMEVSATGFKPTLDWTPMNTAGHTYVYMAIRRGPMRPPESGTDVLAITNGDGASIPAFTSGFPVDFGIMRTVTTSGSNYMCSRLTQGAHLLSNSTAVEAAIATAMFDYLDGWYSATRTSAMYSWMLRRYPGVFDIVCYEGDFTAGHAVKHGLKVPPEMMIVKDRDYTRNWMVYTRPTTALKYMYLDGTIAATLSTVQWNDTEPTEEIFTLGASNSTNANGKSFIALLFASLPGISKVGSFSHVNGTPTNVDCGFSTGARFVLAKRYDVAGYGWPLWDSVRGITASANDPFLDLSSTAAQDNNYDFIDPLPAGFTLNASMATGDYIFLAFS